MFRIVYSFVLFLLFPIYYFLSLFFPVVRNFRKSRLEGYNALKNYLSINKASNKQLIWLHGSSVGEIDQALGLLQILRKKHPDTKIILSTFSLSSRLKQIEGIDLYFYIPLDFPSTWKRLFAIHSPDIFVTMTWDVFPNLLFFLKKNNTRSFLCSASIANTNWRLKPLFNKMVSPVYQMLDGAGCVNKENQIRYMQLCKDINKVKITGDSRFDTIIHRVSNLKMSKMDLDWWKKFKKKNEIVWILASTYRECESIILPLFPKFLEQFSNLKIVIFTHKVNDNRLDQLETSLNKLQIKHMRLSNPESSAQTRVVIADKMGILALSYQYSDFCYVGGGFRSRVHNTAEPAALSNAIITGPNIDWSGIALELERIQVLIRCQNRNQIKQAIDQFLLHHASMKKSGKLARKYILENTGSSVRFYNEFLKDSINLQ